jgi:hypothetical protein
MPEQDVASDLSRMSPRERARLSALIETDGDTQLRQHLLGAMGRSETGRGARGAREIPERWSIIHVLDRLEEGFHIMSMMPAATKPKSYGSAWPQTVQEKIPLIVLAEIGGDEMETRQEEQNRVRLAPSSTQVTRMEQALRWPFEYLSDRPELAKAISLKAMWSAMRTDIRKKCQRRGLDHDEFNRRWQEGLRIITAALIVRKVPVS